VFRPHQHPSRTPSWPTTHPNALQPAPTLGKLPIQGDQHHVIREEVPPPPREAPCHPPPDHQMDPPGGCIGDPIEMPHKVGTCVYDPPPPPRWMDAGGGGLSRPPFPTFHHAPPRPRNTAIHPFLPPLPPLPSLPTAAGNGPWQRQRSGAGCGGEKALGPSGLGIVCCSVTSCWVPFLSGNQGVMSVLCV